MGIFESNNDKSPRSNQRSAISDQVNMIGSGTTFEGTLRAGSDVRISGTLEGTLNVEGRAIIAEEGKVDGTLKAKNADVAGRVEGEVYVSERLVLKSTAFIDGDIQAERLVMEEGARFSGACVMGGEKKVSETLPENQNSSSTAEQKMDDQPEPSEQELADKS